jgi:hypothetical protein
MKLWFVKTLFKLLGAILNIFLMWIAGKTQQIPKIVSGKKVLEEHSLFQIVT